MATAQYLLEGSVYALEQCGLLLTDAVLLYESKSYHSAVALAAFAREELGRSRILFDMYTAVSERAEKVTIEEIEQKCRDHVTKQEWAQLSITHHADNSSQLGKLMQTIIRSHPQSEEHRKAYAELKGVENRKQKRTPQDRHDARKSALYVEPREGGWNRPREITKEFAVNFLMEAANDYALHSIGNPESKLNQALEKWKDHPPLPDPKWPELS
jgi:AbiV family abortive infection protein